MTVRHIIENFIDKKDAKMLMSFFDKNTHLCYDDREEHRHRNIHLPHIKKGKARDLLNYYAYKNIYFIDHLFKTKTKSWQHMRLCRWLPKDSMVFHNDRAEEVNNLMDFSSLIYLNDNYEGGELFFENQTFKMKALSCILFKSNETNMHGVLEVKKGKRYTIPSWYENI